MKKFLLLIILSGFILPVSAETIYRSYDSQTGYYTSTINSQPANYQNNNNNYSPQRDLGYHMQRDKLPSSIANQQIEYGYNAEGDYMPTSLGGKRVEYGRNAQGQYVLTSIDGQKVEYGYNSQGQYVPVSIGGSKIDLDFSKLLKLPELQNFQNTQNSY